MKIIISSSILALTFVFNASAVNITVSNLGDPLTSSYAITDNSGDVIDLGGGSIGVGYFDSFVDADDFSSATISTLLSDFQSRTDDASFQNGFGVDGFFDVTFDISINESSPEFGETLFTVIGNGSSLATSSEFIVFSHDGLTFPSDPDAGFIAISGSVLSGEGTLLLGSVGASVDVSGTTVNSFSMSALAVPEPSSSALLALAGVGFILRRRR